VVPVTEPTKPGRLIVLSGPSGAGKSTILERVIARFSGRLRLSISATTRPPRPGEQDRVHYYFLTPEEFQRRREAGEFLECCEVFGRGHWYGTLHAEVGPSLAAGKWVLLEIDVEGARHVLTAYPEAISIFVRPSSLEELERRLRARGTEAEEAVQRRLGVARRELAEADRYQHQVINDTVDQAVARISQILEESGL
jgi:guanylate kinase